MTFFQMLGSRACRRGRGGDDRQGKWGRGRGIDVSALMGRLQRKEEERGTGVGRRWVVGGRGRLGGGSHTDRRG